MSLTNIGVVVDYRGTPPAEVGDVLEAVLTLKGADSSYRRDFYGEGRPSLTFVQSSVFTLPEDCPHVGADDQRAAVLSDVRLDNRSELSAQLGLGQPSISDQEIVSTAFEKWGHTCARRLRGDFAFIAWDPDQELLVAHRDVFGVRALLWAYEDDRLIVASTLAGVRAALRRPATHNRRFLQHWIGRTPQGLTRETALSEIFWLPPGHQLKARRGHVEVVAYDEVTATSGDRPGSADDAFQRFRHLLTEAVEVRLRARTPIGFRISGGFDSSAILCLANRSAESGRCTAPLRSYSATFSRNRKADERDYLAAVLDLCPAVTPTLLPWDDRPWSVDLIGEEDGFPLEEPPDSSRFAAVPQSQLAVSDGCRVIHEGTWADQLLLRWPYGSPALWWDLPPGVAIQELQRFLGTGLLRFARTVPSGLTRLGRRGCASTGLVTPPETALSAQIRSHFRFGNNGMVMNAKDRRARFLGAEFRYPYLDRALHEFVMALPAEYLFTRGQIKRLQRESLADVLPGAFRTRQTFGAMTHLLIEGACRDRNQIAARLQSPMVVDAGLITPQRIQALLSQIGPAMKPWVTVDLQRVLSVEVWLRHEATLARPYTKP